MMGNWGVRKEEGPKREIGYVSDRKRAGRRGRKREVYRGVVIE